MKKILAFTAILISTIIPCKMYALDLTVGATTWYAQSEQYYTQSGGFYINDLLVKSNPAFLYGPTLSARLSNDFNLTFVFLYGAFDTEKKDGTAFEAKSNYHRSDSDLALNYRLNDYFKVFAGMKYLFYNITPVRTDMNSFTIKSVDTHTSYGPGLGVSATIPIIGNLFCLGTVSGLYLFGKDKVKLTDTSGNNPQNVNLSYNEYGINSTLSLAYYIAQASTVISLGGRLQYLIANYESNAIFLDSIKFVIYGVTLTATYTFNL
ncbi:MAG: hypothetical protein FWG92_04540 [Leptospirales bacterium]|nr:hypothetical protein [Leptospirales bacterium]